MIAYIPLVLGLFAFVVIWLLLVNPPQKSAAVIVGIGPSLLIAAGVLLTVAGMGMVGVPLLLLGVSWWRRLRRSPQAMPTGGKTSTVRTAAVAMELDHDSGEIDGRVLSGGYSGRWLSELSEDELFNIYEEFLYDGETAALLEAYLDRRLGDWRERYGPHASAHASAHGSAGFAEMTREEAYQILGLSSEATAEEIHQTWRRLMKGVHPDSGGSAYLAAKINAAKDLLLG
jgi:hypothetical protein